MEAWWRSDHDQWGTTYRDDCPGLFSQLRACGRQIFPNYNGYKVAVNSDVCHMFGGLLGPLRIPRMGNVAGAGKAAPTGAGNNHVSQKVFLCAVITAHG